MKTNDLESAMASQISPASKRPLDLIPHLHLEPSPEIQRSALEIGRTVRHELHTEKMARRLSMDKVLRIVVR